MTPFKLILAAAEKRAGGKRALARLLPKPKAETKTRRVSAPKEKETVR